MLFCLSNIILFVLITVKRFINRIWLKKSAKQFTAFSKPWWWGLCVFVKQLLFDLTFYIDTMEGLLYSLAERICFQAGFYF